jgi:endoglucanase
VILLVALAAPAFARAAAGGNPFAAGRLFVDPDSAAAHQVRKWADSRPADARQLRKIATQPQAQWLGPWYPDVAAHVRDEIADRLRPAGAPAFFALYNIPDRDCSGYSGGGANSARAYRNWVDRIARAIGAYPAIVEVEPDALAEAGCLSRRGQRERISLIRYANRRLSSLPRTSVYLDAGSATFNQAGLIVRRLRAAGMRYARGFALGSTSDDSTAVNVRYGRRISRAVGHKHFILNTARNGRGAAPRSARHPQDQWCNPAGRALGSRPTARTGNRLVDAYEWISHPGYSDGPCRGGPPSGTWWPDYALELARRAAY